MNTKMPVTPEPIKIDILSFAQSIRSLKTPAEAEVVFTTLKEGAQSPKKQNADKVNQMVCMR